MEFAAQGRREVYGWVERVLVGYEHASLGKVDKGLLRRYVEKMTGMSRAQVTRLIAAYTSTGRVKAAEYERHRFAVRYTKADVELLAYVDRAHGNLSGPATRRILEREHEVHGIAAYERLSRISLAQIYRLRATAGYRKRNASYEPTRPTVIAIGERRRPEANGQPGYLRFGTVHQGDFDGVKGVYHINAVDEVTQWQVMAATPRISEWWLIPVLDAMIAQFPFRIPGFHSDNGSEYINRDVSRLLGKLLIEQTKSRATFCRRRPLLGPSPQPAATHPEAPRRRPFMRSCSTRASISSRPAPCTGCCSSAASPVSGAINSFIRLIRGRNCWRPRRIN